MMTLAESLHFGPYLKTLRWKSRIFLSLFLVLVTAGGCATRARRIPPPSLPSAPLQTREEINDVLAANYGNVNSIKASGEIHFRELKEDNWRAATVVLMARRPDEVRARAYRLLSPTLFEFISSGGKCWLYLPAEQTAYVDNKCGIIENREERFAISSGMIIASLFVVSDIPTFLSLPASISQEDNLVRLSFVEEGGLRREIWIDEVTRLISRQTFSTADGTVEADIKYDEHVARNGSVIPVKAEVILPRAHAAMRLRLDDVELNPKLPSNAFIFSPPPKVRIEKIDRAQP